MPEPNQKWDFFLAHAGSDTPVAESLYDLLQYEISFGSDFN
jgi:hypothetical protein